MANLLDLASLSSYVYNPERSELPTDAGTWVALSGLPANPQTSSLTGFYGEAFENTQTHEIAIAFRGTKDLQNVLEDLTLGLTSKYLPILNAVANDAIAFAQQVAQANPGATITLTGHSLG